MTDLLTLACNNVGVDRDQVVTHEIYEDHIAFVTDQGIAGGKKYLVPLAYLEPMASVEPVTVKSEPEPTPKKVKLNSLPYRDLQSLAVKAGIPANQKKAELIAALENAQ
jgi:hypothetical protein